MAVTDVDEISGSRQSRQDANSTTATRQYRVLTDSFATTEYTVLTNASVPSIGEAFPDNSFLSVESKAAVQVTNEPKNWIVTVNYSTSVPEDKDEIIPDPPARPPEVSITQIKSTEPVHIITDFFNRTGGDTNIVLQNSAGVSYDPPIERDVIDLAINVVQNLEDFNPDDVLGFRGAVNSEVWETFDRGTARIVNIGYVRVTENGVTYWKRSIEIHVREKTDDYTWDTIYPWQILRKNEGVQQVNVQGTTPEPVFLADNGLLLEPIGLDDNGRQQDISTTPTFKRIDPYPKRDFADLDIRLT